MLHLFDRWANVVALCESLLLHFEGAAFKEPSLRPDSPVVGMQAGLDEERINSDDLNAYLRALAVDRIRKKDERWLLRS